MAGSVAGGSQVRAGGAPPNGQLIYAGLGGEQSVESVQYVFLCSHGIGLIFKIHPDLPSYTLMIYVFFS